MRSRKVEIISKELVKPISPTPDHLRCLNLSILDQHSPLMTVPFILYYPHPQQQVCPDQQSRLLLLKESLSQVLARFYPFAGRINSLYTSIICNDYGVPFSHAFAHNYYLDDIIAEPSSNVSLLKHFLPYEESKLSTNIPLLVQVTFFECGGITIGLCASHKFTDAPTLNTLINYWAVVARCDPRATIHEFISAAKFLPPVTVTSDHQPELSYLLPDKVSAANHVTKIFYFDALSIKALKAKAVSDSVPMPTRVEALSALIWKCAMAATTSEKPPLLIHTVNLRKRMVLALPDDCSGNAIALYKAICKDKKDMDLPGLVILLRRGLLEFRDEYEIKHTGNEAIMEIVNAAKEIGVEMERGEMEMYNFTSWCRYQFYETDFGWGRPSWVSRIEFEAKNHVLLTDTRTGGGIEAWVSLANADMEMFQQQLKLLST